jgi:hypothetical protein
VFEYLPHALVRLRRALKVLLGTDLLTDILGLSWVSRRCRGGHIGATDLLGSHRLLRGLVELFNSLLVEAQILLAANKDDGQTLAEVQDF